MIQTNGSTNTETILDKYNYLPNETVQNIKREVGAVREEDSSIALVLTQYNVVTEEALDAQGLLDDMSFEEYVAQNSAVTTLEVPQEITQLVAAAPEVIDISGACFVYSFRPSQGYGYLNF